MHSADAIALQAQADLTNAYNVAAGQPVSPANDLSGTDLGNRLLKAGAYRFTAAAQLTGALTLDAEGDPNAQFVFQVASALTTAPGSSVVLLNGANPCNVYWQVGSSATLDTTTAFQGNLMALSSISLKNAATVIGRVLARNGQVSLINNVLDSSRCATGADSPSDYSGNPGTPGPPGTPGTPATSTPTASAAAARLVEQANRAINPKPTTTRNGTTTMQRSPHATCTSDFRATVRGKHIKRVVFKLDGKRIDSQAKGPYRVFVRAMPGAHNVTARVTFTDAIKAKTLALGELRRAAGRPEHFRDGFSVRSFSAVVPMPSTPTPYGEFFVEEALAISPDATGGPFALAISARSDVFQTFGGGPGQTAIHGTGNLSAPLGTAASHGCIRLGPTAITWMSKRIGGGVLVTVRL